MKDPQKKTEKKIAKARVKVSKAARAATVHADSGVQPAPGLQGGNLPGGVSITINHDQGGSRLIVSGLRDDQLRRIVPQVNKEVLITVTEDRNSLVAGLMRFVREGVFQTLIKIVAGLIVGYVLLKLGLS